jgi:hypothetical protein
VDEAGKATEAAREKAAHRYVLNSTEYHIPSGLVACWLSVATAINQSVSNKPLQSYLVKY